MAGLSLSPFSCSSFSSPPILQVYIQMSSLLFSPSFYGSKWCLAMRSFRFILTYSSACKCFSQEREKNAKKIHTPQPSMLRMSTISANLTISFASSSLLSSLLSITFLSEFCLFVEARRDTRIGRKKREKSWQTNIDKERSHATHGGGQQQHRQSTPTASPSIDIYEERDTLRSLAS